MQIKDKNKYANGGKFAILNAHYSNARVTMGMSNRMHGKSGPFKVGLLKVCPHCKSRYFMAKLVWRRSKMIRVCPKCNRPIPRKNRR